jgi:amidohydrolase
LAFQEVETTRAVARFFKSRGIPFEVLPSGTGGVAVVGPGSGPAVLLRADLDALPVEEETETPFRSRHPQRMHACGHDAHAAILAATADALASGDLPYLGRAVCLFQPAEEGPGGCLKTLEEGFLDRHPCERAAALHVWPGLPVGMLGISPGPTMAGMDRLSLTLRGRGGHGAFPQACIDPIVMAAETILSLQSLVSRSLNPLDAGVLTLGSVHGGAASNVIPDTVEIDGTIRFYEPHVRATLLGGVRRIAAGVAAAHGGSCELRTTEGYPVTQSDTAVTATLSDALTAVLGHAALTPAHRSMGAEDMAFLLERVPGCYIQLGASTDPSTAAPLHSPRFSLDERCLEVGVTVLLTAAFALA